MNATLDYSRITDQVYIAAWPSDQHVAIIKSLNVRLILCMFVERLARPLTLPPFQMLHLRTFDSPLLPMPLSSLRRGVERALPEIRAGRSVLVYCKQGRHRSVAMACCILIGLGYSAEDAMKLVKEKRPAADPGAWHIKRRIHKFEQRWQERRSN
jgi:hypothetical protein